jgi:geranylgeranyl transferase type-2 subunit beta
MSPSPYLDLLDSHLREGLRGASGAFVESQIRFVLDCRVPDGGFRGREGDSDLYYTDFGLRCLALLSPGHPAIAAAKEYLERPIREPSSIVECFSLLNLHRLTEAVSPKNDLESFVERRLLESLLPGGGFSRFGVDGSVSAYHTFLASLCMQILGKTLPLAKEAVAAIEKLKRPQGGFAEFDGQAEPQTNATAAAAAFLMMHDAMTEETSVEIVRFLASVQSSDGGVKAHASIENGDLLSTFTGVLTLAGFDALSSIDTAALAQFLRRTAAPQGGFLACDGDETPDVEYAYYGIATYSLLNSFQRLSK